MTMTQGEMMVWAAAFAQVLLEFQSNLSSMAEPDLDADAAAIATTIVQKMRTALPKLEQAKAVGAVQTVREMLGLPPLVTALPPLSEGFPAAPDYTAPPPGYSESWPGEWSAQQKADAWARHKAEHLPVGYVVTGGDDPSIFPGPLYGVEVMIGEESGMLDSFTDMAEARSFAWRCAEKPHHVNFYETYRYGPTPHLDIVLEWSDEQLLHALNYIAEHQAWRGREPVRPDFFPFHED